MKKACLYVIQKYQNLTSEGDKTFFNQAIQNVIKRMKIRELSTYALDQEIKLLMSFTQKIANPKPFRYQKSGISRSLYIHTVI